jgi:hypothetical protein
VIGSAIGFKGTGVKACKDQIKMAVVLPQFPDEMFLLRVPPNSFKHLRTLTDWCRKNEVQMEQVVTRIWFEQGIVGTLMFGAVDYLRDEQVFKFIAGSVTSKATDALVGRNDIPRTQALPAPSKYAPNQPGHPVTPTQAPQNALPQSFQPGPTPLSASPAMAPQAPVASPTATASPSEQPRRRRRTKEQIAADNAAGQAPQGQLAAPMQAPFMAAPPAPNASPTPGNGTNFGIQPGAAPNPELMQTLNSIFPAK